MLKCFNFTDFFCNFLRTAQITDAVIIKYEGRLQCVLREALMSLNLRLKQRELCLKLCETHSALQNALVHVIQYKKINNIDYVNKIEKLINYSILFLSSHV